MKTLLISVILLGIWVLQSYAQVTTTIDSAVSRDTASSTLQQSGKMLRRDLVRTMIVKASMNVQLKDFQQAASAVIRIADRDSLAMEIMAFGIPVAKLYMNKSKFMFMDLFNGRFVEGPATAANMANVTNIPLSFDDFICLLRCESPFPASAYSLEGTTKSGNHVLRFDRPDTNREFIAVNIEESVMKQYQRKDKDGTLLMNITYADIMTIDSQLFPKKVQVQAPGSQFSMTVENKEIILNSTLKEPFIFKIPQGIEKQQLN
jgi:hypothetical protein